MTLGDRTSRRRTMAEYDALPPALRGWLARARMQWDPVSARRAWRGAMRRALWRERVALRLMDDLEDDRLASDPLVRARARSPGDG